MCVLWCVCVCMLWCVLYAFYVCVCVCGGGGGGMIVQAMLFTFSWKLHVTYLQSQLMRSIWWATK